MARRPGEVGLSVISAIVVGFRIELRELRLGGDVDGLTIGQTDIRLAPALARTSALLERLDLALHIRDVDRLDLDVEQGFDGVFHFLLVRARGDLEHILTVFLRARGLLRNMRSTDHAIQTLVLQQLAHLSHSSIFLTESTVITTCCASTRVTGSIAATSTTATYGRLRADRYRFWLTSSVTISVRPV